MIKITPDHLQAIEVVVERLANKFKFGYYDAEDIAQEVRVFCLELLAKNTHDPSRPLAPYLYRHALRRTFNLKRNKYRRADYPCSSCASGSPCQPDGTFCPPFVAWKARNDAKAGLVCPTDISNVSPDHTNMTTTGPEEDVEVNELLRVVDEKLDIHLRADWLRIRAGVKVPRERRERVRQAVQGILEEVGVDIPFDNRTDAW